MEFRYLFWVLQGQDKGVYRLDLSMIGSVQLAAVDVQSLRIVHMNPLSSLTVDCVNYRIFFPNESHNTMMSTYMDGSDLINVRTNTQSPDFLVISSLAVYDGSFYWANKKNKVLMEEYDPIRKVYHHNEMMMRANSFTGFNIWHSSAQPCPSWFFFICSITVSVF